MDSAADVHDWLDELAGRAFMRTTRLPLEELSGWREDPATGNLHHARGGFFTVEGLEVSRPGWAVPAWSQPIINQPETGVLGILLRRVGGVPYLLMQAKNEPGNPGGPQLSPTVQATRSNYTRVHRGRAVPYLEHFRAPRGRVLADARQSEQGAWFYRKRNRNMIVEVDGEVEAVAGFQWLPLRRVRELLAVPDAVNMDARTVLACLPVQEGADEGSDEGEGAFGAAVARSRDRRRGSLHGTPEILSWLSGVRSTTDVHARPVPLNRVSRWLRAGGRISHETGRFFDVIGVGVEAGGREVDAWSQPMIAPVGTGVAAFLVRRAGGVVHVLAHARVEPGCTDVVELAPTVQCTPGNYDHLPPGARPPLLAEVLGVPPERVLFDTVLSEEGGRFHHARTRYLLAEVDEDPLPGHPAFRWLALHQLDELLRHSYYLNVQARTLTACLHGLTR
ncbi:NDP-hexose 2,3-dehydratase family protein [Planomonospora sp. ID82291]|uniref:NDP-hexose 2,3-dehydratase family protein n=1 Tax=Planomonospora sp. ID82291 TaxID=2738136 RepID=UPI0018C431E6|nr:NDP-hexose 2,3-dehydratase family protein [Planomonospora sp. ID82291]MBG0813176.1 NDP-hexose 2,3-dehydratase family protein [Planomonospora sp. ID82291]